MAGLRRLDPGPCPRAVPAPRPSAETQPSTDRERPGAEGNSSRCASAPAGRNNVFFLFTHFAEASARLAPQGGGEVRAPRPVSSRLTRHVLRVLSLGVQPRPPSPPNRPPQLLPALVEGGGSRKEQLAPAAQARVGPSLRSGSFYICGRGMSDAVDLGSSWLSQGLRPARPPTLLHPFASGGSGTASDTSGRAV